jgi:hypothetical protein
VCYYAGDGRRSLLSEVGRPGSARHAIEWELGEQRGRRRGNGSHDYHGTDECNTHLKRCKEGCKSDLQPGAIERVAVLWAETAFEDRPGCNSIHENWQVPGQEILNAPTRLERIRALGGWEAANPHCRLTQDLLGVAC